MRFFHTSLAATAILLVLVAPGHADSVSYNVVLHKVLDNHPSANDCWGYTAPNGTELAIYGHQTGTAFVDATDPANAVEIFNLPGPTSVWRDMKTYLNYAYIVTEGGGAGTGLQIVDLTDPLNPDHVATYTGNGYDTAHNIWIDAATGVAYLCGASGGGMYILSLADPENPTQLDYFSPYYIHDLYVGDGRAYAGGISSGTLRIIDVTNPANPSTILTHAYPNAATHNAWPNVAKTHCATSDETGGGHMKIWDITNLSDVTLSGQYEVPGIIHNIIMRGDMAYISYYTAGARIVDLTDPTDPIEVGYYDTSTVPSGFNGNWGVYPFRSDDVFYASDRENGLFVLEFTGGFAGEITGTVSDAQTFAVLPGATVEITGVASFETDGSGVYSGRLAGGTVSVITSLFTYESDTTTVVIPEAGVVVHDVALQRLPIGAVEFEVVRAGDGTPIEGVRVDFADTPLTGYVTDAAGRVNVPGVPAGPTWTARLARFGYAVTDVNVVAPAGGTNFVTVELGPGFDDEFEFDQAWTVGAPDDDATDGIWERAIPVGSYYLGIVGPEEDASATGDGYAYITEQHQTGLFVGTSDVDGGKTTLLSPVFDGSGLGDLQLQYQRWFSNRAPIPDDDEFRADVSTDGGASWTNLETVSVGTDSWAAVTIDLTAAVPATATMQLRFVAEDLDADTFVEAGVDDVRIVAPGATDAIVVGEASRLRLGAAAPNPFREGTTLSFELPASVSAQLEVFDVLGRKVTTLLEGERLGAGTHRVLWEGRDAAGRTVVPGVYFVKLTTPKRTMHRKVVRVR